MSKPGSEWNQAFLTGKYNFFNFDKCQLRRKDVTMSASAQPLGLAQDGLASRKT